MKSFILISFLVLVVINSISSSPAKEGRSVDIHTQNHGRTIDIHSAKNSINNGNAWKVNNNNRDREIYEGSYTDREGTHYFRVVLSKNDGHVISSVRLTQAPQRPHGVIVY